ncbi:MAG: Gfo/Idh/MocA family oxidoreductase [Rickettsiales bacterium]
MANTKIAVIGCGYWGKNLVRNMAELGVLHCVADSNAQTAKDMAAKHSVRVNTVAEIMADKDIAAVVIASSAATHFALAKQAMESGKHVFVEKPLALDVKEAAALSEIAAEKKLVLMVGHLLQYHPAFVKLLAEVKDGRIGKLRYIQSHRLSFGKVRTEENVVWSFAPHDISMILAIAGQAPDKVLTRANTQISDGICDIATLHLNFPGKLTAHVMVSWLHPVKEHRLTVIGEKGALVFDDAKGWDEKLVFYENKVSFESGAPFAQKGEATAIKLSEGEPLKLECQHFIDAVSRKTEVRTDSKEAIRVLEVLSASEKSLKTEGEVSLENNKNKDYFAHDTAVIDDGCVIGHGSKIWHFSHVLKGTKIGKNVVVGQNVMVGPDVTVGDNCKIQNNVSLYKGVSLADGVFCGPSCVFTNVNTPRSEVERKDEFLATPVGRGATIGANATIICGNKIGEYSLIGAGAVITKEVKPHALMVGNPAKRIGWVSHSGEKLGEDLVCSREGRRYRENGDGYLEEIVSDKGKKKDEKIRAA